MRALTVTISMMVLVILACDTSSTSEMESVSSTRQMSPGETSAGFLLTEDSAVSILQNYLQECVLSWRVEHESPVLGWEMERGRPLPSEREQRWWMDLASAAIGEIEWSAEYYGSSGGSETWVVVGPGLKRGEGDFAVVSGRWRVTSGNRIASPLDGPARLAQEEYKKPLDSRFDPDCRGYSER